MNLIIRADVANPVKVCVLNAEEDDLKRMKPGGLLSFRKTRILAAGAVIVVGDDNVTAVVAEIDYHSLNVAVDAVVVLFDAEHAIIYGRCNVSLHGFFSLLFKAAERGRLTV